MQLCGLEGSEHNVWLSPRYGTCRWQGHLLIDRPKIGNKYPSCYTLKMYDGFVSPVQVQQAGRKEWKLYVLGELIGTYTHKVDAQIEAEQLIGVR